MSLKYDFYFLNTKLSLKLISLINLFADWLADAGQNVNNWWSWVAQIINEWVNSVGQVWKQITQSTLAWDSVQDGSQTDVDNSVTKGLEWSQSLIQQVWEDISDGQLGISDSSIDGNLSSWSAQTAPVVEVTQDGWDWAQQSVEDTLQLWLKLTVEVWQESQITFTNTADQVDQESTDGVDGTVGDISQEWWNNITVEEIPDIDGLAAGWSSESDQQESGNKFHFENYG